MSIASLPAPVRHFILGLTATVGSALVGYAATNQAELVAVFPVAYQAVAAVVLGAVLAYVTPLVQSYGVGSNKVDGDAGE